MQTNNGEADKQRTKVITLDDVPNDPDFVESDNKLIEGMANKADRVIAKYMLKIIECIGINIVNKCHAPSVRVLFEIASRHNNNEPIAPAEYQSFAETLTGIPGFVDDSEEKDEEEEGEQE